MAKQLNVNLAFTADTSQAKAKLQELQNTLTQIVNTPTSSFGVKMTKDIQSAVRSAAELKVHLQNATNANTGNLDFSKLNQSIKQSGTSLQEYSAKLQSLGASGQQAFMQLAQSVATAEIPIRRSNAALTEMWATLKNTARWQISSSILHGFMGAVQSAYGYAQDLNESLNNIRIVTNKNIDEMAEFAEQANKAAKALSSTTTEYTDAALIYYQQGLEGKAVEERAETTLKLANVSRQSAEVVSDQMTAVWNNFYDGSKSLEYYADVMTALGAATASSTDEIAQGLEKFAAIADTVGLSYEYATAALATVTSETRQSADVVGTAFKTLFARIEGLSLGETLDDGTDLNKYSEALMTVGISIKDQNGNLRDMDSILNDMGDKWSSLSKDQQIALAQTVGGVRQYNQLISLMDNWDKFQQNLGTAYGSTGALQEQADIYAESWEAAQERVRAAAETIYSDLLNDEAFIDILNGVEKFLTLLDNIIDSMGGLQGVLAGVSALMLKVFSDQAAQGITNMAYSLQMMTKSGREKIQNEKKSFIDNAVNSIQVDETAEPNANTTRQNMLRAELEVQQELIDKAEKMSEIEKSTNQVLLDRQRTLAENAILAAEELDKAKKEKGDLSFDITTDVIAESEAAGFEGKEAYEEFVKKDLEPKRQMLQNSVQIDTDITELVSQFNEGQISAEQFNDSLLKISQKATEIGDERLVKLIGALENGEQGSKELVAGLDEVQGRIKKIQNDNKKGIVQLGVDSKKVDKLIDSYYKEEKANKKSKKATEDANKAREQTSKSIEKSQGAQKKWSDTLVQSAQSVSSVVMGLSSLSAAWDTLTNPDISGWEKFSSVFMSVAMGLPAVINGITGFKNALSTMAPIQKMILGIEQQQQLIIDKKITKMTAEQLAKKTDMTLDEAQIAISKMKSAAALEEAIATESLTAATSMETIASTLGISTDQAEIISSKMKTGATLEEAAAEAGLTVAEGAETAATIAQTAANWGLMASMPPILIIMLAIMAAALVLVGIIMLITKALQGQKSAQEKANERMQASAQAANELSENLDKVKQRAEEVKEAFQNYESLTDKLNSLTKGTSEWQATLLDVQNSIQNIMETYPELIGATMNGEEAFKVDEATGLLTMADWVQTYANQKISDELIKATVARTYGNIGKYQSDFYGTELKMRESKKKAAPGLGLEQWEYFGQEYQNGDVIGGNVTFYKDTFSYKKEKDDYGNLQSIIVTTENNEASSLMAGASLDDIEDFFGTMGSYINASGTLDQITSVDELKEMWGDGTTAFAQEAKKWNYVGEGAFDDLNEDQMNYLFDTFCNGLNTSIEGLSDYNGQLAKLNEAIKIENDMLASTLLGKTSQYSRLNENEMTASSSVISNLLDDSTAEWSVMSMAADSSYTTGKQSGLVVKQTEESKDFIKNTIAPFVEVELSQNEMGWDFNKDIGYNIENSKVGQGILEKYLELSNYKTEGYGTEDFTATGVTLTGVIDTAGKIVEDFTVSYETMIQMVSAAEAMESINVDGIVENIMKITDPAILAGLAGNMAQLAPEELEKIMVENSDGTRDFTQHYKDQLLQSYNEVVGEENQLNWNEFKNTDAYEDAINSLQSYSAELYRTQELQKDVTAGNSLISQAASELDLDEDALKNYAKTLQSINSEYELSYEQAAQLAVANAKLSKGLETLRDNWDDNYKILSTYDRESFEVIETATEAAKSLSQIFGVDVSSDFVLDNLETINEAIEGNVEAFKELETAAAKDYITHLTLDTEYKNILNSMIDDIESYGDMSIGVQMNLDQGYVDSLNEMLENGLITADQLTSLFASVGWTPEIEMKPVDGPETTTTSSIYTGDSTEGKPLYTVSSVSKSKVQVPVMKANRNGDVKITSTGKKSYSSNLTSKSPNSSGSGDSSPAEKVERTKKSDVVNRYEEIEDKLDDIRDAADKAAGAMDRLYGADRIKAMKEQNKYLKEEINALKNKRKQAEQYLKEDIKTLDKAAKEAGVRFEFDDMGNVTNYTEQMTRLYNQLSKAETYMDTLGTKEAQDDYQETHVQPIQDAIGALKEEYDGYEETRELIEDLDSEIQEAIYAWQDANAEILNYEIELQVEVDERELQKIEYYLGKMEDDFYSSAESIALLGEKIALTQQSLSNNENNIARLKQMYDAGEISQAAYVEGLKEEESKMYDNLQTLQEYDKEMMNYYGETLDKAQEELASYTDKMEHATSVLDHYRSLLDLTGQSQNFKAIGTVLESQAKTIENSYQIAKENYEWLADEAVKKKQAMNDALARGDAEAAEFYENEWKAAEEKMREAQDNMLSMAEEWAGKLKEVLENKLAEIADVLENALTGGRSFDELSMQMEHAQGIQEEYLTTTNKIYETNKMIRNAQNEIDKTTNTVAKQKLKAFQQETQQLQNQVQLSQFELDIQQKKYDLLLAKIALEEAQNAKSLVRLQRDSEGNFGYVYTADQNQIADAEQAVEDAENALYNARIEAANNYTSQRQELLQGLYDSLTNLDNQYYNEGVISEEEYNRQKEAIQSYYFERLAQNSELYAIATSEDATISQEAWSTSLGIMGENASNLVEAVDAYLSNSRDAFNEYQISINKVAEETGVDLDILASNVQDITDESNKLKTEVVDKVIPALQDEVDKVNEITSQYALHRNELALVMESYENLLKDIGNVITEMRKLATECDSIKTKADKAASAVGTIGNIKPQTNTKGKGGGNPNVYPTQTLIQQGNGVAEVGDLVKFKRDVKGAILNGIPTAFSVPKTPLNEGHIQQGRSFKISSYIAGEEFPYGITDGSGKFLGYAKKDWIQGFDTGGYTGEWGPEGKWALLHQKELVLNASQTEDLLMTMELLESIIKQIDMMTMNNKINQMSAAMNQAINTMYKEQVAQEIHVEANFPNATDRNEIYQAFEMLANDTSQFINR